MICLQVKHLEYRKTVYYCAVYLFPVTLSTPFSLLSFPCDKKVKMNKCKNFKKKKKGLHLINAKMSVFPKILLGTPAIVLASANVKQPIT